MKHSWYCFPFGCGIIACSACHVEHHARDGMYCAADICSDCPGPPEEKPKFPRKINGTVPQGECETISALMQVAWTVNCIIEYLEYQKK